MVPAASGWACRWAAAWACGIVITSEAPAPVEETGVEGPGPREAMSGQPHAESQRWPQRRVPSCRSSASNWAIGQAKPRPLGETYGSSSGPGQRKALMDSPTLG
jgi:hypothetical protein